MMIFLLLATIILGRSCARKLVVAVDGGTESIRAALFDAETGQVVGNLATSPYTTLHPHAGWAEQDPGDWWKSIGSAVRQAVESLNKNLKQSSESHLICAISLDTTCCSVVALDKNYKPVAPCILWMDQRSADEAEQIMKLATGNPALTVNSNGQGPVSAEWMTPKALWMSKTKLWPDIRYLCEYQDYMNLRLTGVFCASACNAATRWHWDGNECTKQGTSEDPYPGRPLSLYQSIGIPDLADKLPQKCYPMGRIIGELTSEAAVHLNLPAGLPVVQGGPDAFVGMVGLGCIRARQMCLITGSSHLHCVVAEAETTAEGIWGAYRGAPLEGLNFAEGGQSSTGSVLRWLKDQILGDQLSYQQLDHEAAKIDPGADGLIAVETFQGSRTPVTDSFARGALLGLTLSHTRAHIWRACLEAVCYGTRMCIEALEGAGHECCEIIMAGGVTRSQFWLQMHADVTGKPIVLCESSDNAPLLGCAVLASYGAGIHSTIDDAVRAMVRTSKRIFPILDHKRVYDTIYDTTYKKATMTARDVSHSIVREQRGSSDLGKKAVTVSPSLLACDWADIRSEVDGCIQAGLTRLHIDIFDGVFLDSPNALTFGPQMVSAIRRCCDGANVTLDLHMCVVRPDRFVAVMAESGASTFIFQWESMEGEIKKAIALCAQIRAAGMIPGISINPTTGILELLPLLRLGVVDIVDILAVAPGFGGQIFQESALNRIASLKSWRTKEQLVFDIMVDGGINNQTASHAADSGADILVAGSYLFNSSSNISDAASSLLKATLRRGSD